MVATEPRERAEVAGGPGLHAHAGLQGDPGPATDAWPVDITRQQELVHLRVSRGERRALLQIVERLEPLVEDSPMGPTLGPTRTRMTSWSFSGWSVPTWPTPGLRT